MYQTVFMDNFPIKAKAKEQGITPRELCQRAVEEHGSIFLAAVALKVYPNTVRYHLTHEKQPRKHTSKE